MKQITEH